MSNLESQENELLSLQSIYEKKEFFVDKTNPPSGHILVEVRLPHGFYVTSEKIKQPGAAIHKEILQVSHLPPINLYFEFPESYPLETCPEFVLSCKWLSLQQLSVLCQQLEYLWEVNMDAILYTWIQFLQEETLDFLNIGQFLDISELLTFEIKDNFRHRDNENLDDCAGCSVTGDHKTIDLRAFNELSDGKTIIQILKDYNEHKEESIFCTTIQDCDVCLLRKLGSEFIRLKSCKHFFCKDCVKQYFEELIKDGSVSSLKCLQEECSTQVDGSTIKELVGPNLYERYDKLLLSTTLEGMSDIAYCPRRDCQCACIIDTCGRMGTCSACSFVFCPLCKMTYHGIEPCSIKSERWKHICEEYIAGDCSVKEEIEKLYGKKAFRFIIEDALSESWKSCNSKSCPHCCAAIEKSEGCNKMICIKCGTYFCWLCMKELENGNPYFHYNNPSSKCYNLLYPEDIIDNEFED